MGERDGTTVGVGVLVNVAGMGVAVFVNVAVGGTCVEVLVAVMVAVLVGVCV